MSIHQRQMQNLIGANNQDFRTIPSLWPDLAGAWVLDIGAGSGLYAGELSRRGAIAVAVDLDRETLRMAIGGDGGGRRLSVCADAAALPFRDGVFDMALSIEVLTHISPQSRQQVFVGVCRVLKDGARAYYTLHSRLRMTLSRWARLRRARDMYPTDRLNVWPLHPSQAREALLASGMRTVPEVKYLNYHSRFSHAFNLEHPKSARVVIALEEVFSRLPVLRRLAITFLCIAEKAGTRGGGDDVTTGCAASKSVRPVCDGG
jgi:SAM-dependent methyltransferase